MWVYLMSHDVAKKSENGIRVSVRGMWIHPLFSETAYHEYDVAVLRLSFEIDSVEPICLACDLQPSDSLFCQSAGWGV